jgi:hypothetical protein
MRSKKREWHLSAGSLNAPYSWLNRCSPPEAQLSMRAASQSKV